MAKPARKKPFWKFLIGMLVYALVFLGAVHFGLRWFWGYMDAYEQSRPETAMNAYMEKVDVDYLCAGGVAPVIDAIDLRIQSEEACLEYIKSTLTGDIRYACKMSECTEDKMVYMVLCGERGICKVTLTPQPADQYGFTRWMVASEEFDFSHIKSSTATITVPYDFSVCIGDACLDENYLIGERVNYPELEEYYDSYSPPYLVTYQSGAFLGELPFVVTNPQGVPVTIDADTDMTDFINNCSPEQNDRLESLVDTYIRKYVDFLSCTGNDLDRNYQNLIQYLVPDCELSKRFQAALAGMYWINDRHTTVTAITIDRRVDLGGGTYLCTATYEVDTHLLTGLDHEISNVHLMITETDDGLKVESMAIK